MSESDLSPRQIHSRRTNHPQLNPESQSAANTQGNSLPAAPALTTCTTPSCATKTQAATQPTTKLTVPHATAAHNENFIEGYQLLKKIGSGGMSTVYEVISPDGTHAALKLLHPAIAGNQLTRQRLRREVTLMQRIKGTHVAQILDAELDGENLFIVTELINGPTLETDVREEGRYTEEDLSQLGAKLATALQEIHQAGVLHRDLKPSNVMIRDGEPVLIDFGISQSDTDARLTQTGFLTHTPGFCDPRILLGALPDETADWWAMSAVLAYAATGVYPFGSGAPVAVANRVLNEKPNLPRLTADLQELFTLALAPKLTQRISYQELLAGISDPVQAEKIIAEKTDLKYVAFTDNFSTNTLNETIQKETTTGAPQTQTGNSTIPFHLNSNTANYPSYPPQNNEKENTEYLHTADLTNNTPATQQLFLPPTVSSPNPAPLYPRPPQNTENTGITGTISAPAAAFPNTHITGSGNQIHAQNRSADTFSQNLQTYPEPISKSLNPEQLNNNNANRYYVSKSLGSYPVITLLLAAILIGCSTAKPLFGYLLLLTLGAIFGTIGAIYTKLTARRIRRGSAGSLDFGLVLMHLPLALLGGIWRSLFSGLIGALSAMVLLFAIGYDVHGLNLHLNLDYTNLQASIQAYFAQFISAGKQFLASIPIFVFPIGLLVYWFFPSSTTIRTGLKVVLREIIPSPAYHIFWIILLFIILTFEVFAGFF